MTAVDRNCTFNFEKEPNCSMEDMQKYFNEFCDEGYYFKDFVLHEKSVSFVTNNTNVREFKKNWNTGQFNEKYDERCYIISYEVDGQLFDY
jgi:hypothetical protein